MKTSNLNREEINIIRQRSIDWDVTVNELKIELLGKYTSLLKTFAVKYGFISTHDHDDLFEKHIIDSLEVLTIIKDRRKKKILDVGSGAGLPGIPISIMCPTLDVTLLERSSRKYEFLQSAVRRLNLGNITVMNMSVEELANKNFISFNFILFRAVKSFNECKILANPFTLKGATLIYYNRRHGEIHERFITHPKKDGFLFH